LTSGSAHADGLFRANPPTIAAAKIAVTSLFIFPCGMRHLQ
jgi:hypothetical protein